MHDEEDKRLNKSHSISHLGDFMPFSHEELRYLTHLKKKNSDNITGRDLSTIENNSTYAALTRQSKMDLINNLHEPTVSSCIETIEKHHLDSWKRNVERNIDETFNGLKERINPIKNVFSPSGNNLNSNSITTFGPNVTPSNNFSTSLGVGSVNKYNTNPFTGGTTGGSTNSFSSNIIGNNLTGSFTNPLSSALVTNSLSNPSSVVKGNFTTSTGTGSTKLSGLGITNYFPTTTTTGSTNTYSSTNQYNVSSGINSINSFNSSLNTLGTNPISNNIIAPNHNITNSSNQYNKTFGTGINNTSVTSFNNPTGFTNNLQGGFTGNNTNNFTSSNTLSNQRNTINTNFSIPFNNTLNPNTGINTNGFFTNQTNSHINTNLMSNSLSYTNFNTNPNIYATQMDQFGNPIYANNTFSNLNPLSNNINVMNSHNFPNQILSQSQSFVANNITNHLHNNPMYNLSLSQSTNPQPKMDINKVLDTAYQTFQSSIDNLEAAYNVPNREKIRAQLMEIAILNDLRKPTPKKNYYDSNISRRGIYDLPDEELSRKEREVYQKMSREESYIGPQFKLNNSNKNTNNYEIFKDKEKIGKYPGGSQYNYTPQTVLEDVTRREDSYTNRYKFISASNNISNNFSQTIRGNKPNTLADNTNKNNNFFNSINKNNTQSSIQPSQQSQVTNASLGITANTIHPENKYLIHFIIDSPFQHDFKLRVNTNKIYATILKTKIINHLVSTDGLEAVRFEMKDFEIINIESGKILTGGCVDQIDLENLAISSKSAPNSSKHENNGETGNMLNKIISNTVRNQNITIFHEFNFKISFHEAANNKLSLLKLDPNFNAKMRINNSTSKNSQMSENNANANNSLNNTDFLPYMTKNYHTQPDYNLLRTMTQDQLKKISNFKVWNGNGSIEYLEDVDLTKVNLDCICLREGGFNIEFDCVDSFKLKKQALVTLKNYAPMNENDETEFEIFLNSLKMTCLNLGVRKENFLNFLKKKF
jgi:hypothetical protein